MWFHINMLKLDIPGNLGKCSESGATSNRAIAICSCVAKVMMTQMNSGRTVLLLSFIYFREVFFI